jgi:tRNA(fMet)-specific endonuclease VapC
MTYLLDTNACVVHLRKRGRTELSQRLGAIDPTLIATCSVVRAELLAGAHHGKAPQDELTRVLELLSLFQSLPFDDAAADQYGKVRAHIESQGTPIGSNDLMIASIALANNLILVTHNCSEFTRVPDLKVEDWQASP